MKKIIGLLLTVCMTFGIGATAFAYSDVEENTKVAEAVSFLTDLEVVNGFEDGSYKPEQTITRAEMAKMICELLDIVAAQPYVVIFDDVPTTHWAIGYINAIANLGIINGYGDGSFGPDDILTYEQVIKMVVCALGYEPMATTKGGYPQGYLAVASSIGLTANVTGATRGDIAIILANALETPVMEQISYGSEVQYAPLDGTNGRAYKTLLTASDIYKATGVVGDLVDTNKIKFTITKDSKDGEFSKNDKDQTFYVGSSNIADYKHQEVETFVTKEDGDYTIISIKASSKTETLTIVSDDIKSIDGNRITYYIDDNQSKTKTLTIDATNFTVEYNKSELVKTIADFENEEDVQLVFVENNGDSKYDALVATKYTSEKINLVDSYKDKIVLNSTSIKFDFEDADKIYVFKDQNGNELDLSDFNDDDVVAWYCNTYKNNNLADPANASYIEIIKLDNSVVVGSIETVTNSTRIVEINGVEYKVAKTLFDNSSDFTPGAEGTFYVGITGKIVYYDDTRLNTNYGYILAVGTEGTFETNTVIKLLTTNGIKTYTLKSSVTNAVAGKMITYTVNSKGLISSITNIGTAFADKEYNADTEILNEKFIDKDTILFIIDSQDADDSYVKTMKYLTDEAKYSGLMYVNKYEETKAIAITKSDVAYTNVDGFAIVTGLSTTTKDGEKVYAVSYVQNSVKSTVYFEDSADAAEFAIGTVFVFKADNNNYVNNYEIVAAVNNDKHAFIEKTTTDIGKNVKVVTGYIANETRQTNTKGEVITINGKAYVITSTANKYTLLTNDKIEVEDFLAGDAYYKDDKEVTSVLLKIVDDVVIDIYTISDRYLLD